MKILLVLMMVFLTMFMGLGVVFACDNPPRNLRNNNFLNIRNYHQMPWTGQVVPSKDLEFMEFDTAGHGYMAARNLVRYQISQGHNTIAKLVKILAPEPEKTVPAYVAFVAKHMQKDSDSVMTADDIYPYIIAASIFEGSRDCDRAIVELLEDAHEETKPAD